MKKEDVPRAFSNEAEFDEAYERFLADLPQAGEAIKSSHEEMEASFRDYLDAFEKWVFYNAYKSGYAAAMAVDNDSIGASAEPIMEQLRREALYAQRSFLEGLLHEVYGKAKMARDLEAITKEEFMEINDMTIRFMNTDREFIRRRNEEFFRGCDGTVEKDGPAEGYRVKIQYGDGTKEYRWFGTMEQVQELYDILDGRAEIQQYNGALGRYEAVVYPTFEY